MDELLFKGGTIVDGTGKARFNSDILIKNGRIKAIEPEIKCLDAREIDVKGKILAPGFIDSHSHSDLALLVNPKAEEKIMQGFTTEILGQDGLSLAPLATKEHKRVLKSYIRALAGPFSCDWTWSSLDDYFGCLAQQQPSINVASFAGHNTIRSAVLGFGNPPISPNEIKLMSNLLHEAMEQGAVGMSTGLIYQPGCYADLQEMVGLGKIIAQYDGVHTSHIRSQSNEIVDSYQEMCAVSQQSGVKVNITHLKVSGKRNWGIAANLIGILEKLAAQGLGGTGDQYPYLAGSTMLLTLLPPWVLEGGVALALERISDTINRNRIRKDYDMGIPGWDSNVRAIGWDNILVNSVAHSRNKIWEGKTLAKIALEMGKEPVDALCDLLLSDDGASNMITFQQDENDHDNLISYQRTMFGTDGIFVSGKPHPRLNGTMPRILGRYVREKKLFTLEEAIYKASYLPAKTYHLKDIGVLRKGMWADLVVFDENEVIDSATFEEPTRANQGIEYVVVSGQLVVEKGRHTKKRPGRIIRRGI
jgi:N-acyl-D-amino-acid deacylase